ncbi:MAG: hypothetical protein JWN14_21 [Chthonomonadales bacterium]|nr:hypothetical protein [Chthonomonadales bacterium]
MDSQGLEFAEKVRRTIGRALADIAMGHQDGAVESLGKLCTEAHTLVQGSKMAEEREALREDRFDLAALRVDLGAEAPELQEE